MYFVENKFVALDVLRTTNLCKEYSQVRKIWVFLGVAPCKRIRDPWNFCLWNPEYEKLLLVESRIWLKESGIPLTIEIQSPRELTKTGTQYLESEIHSVESGIQNCLGFPYMGRVVTWVLFSVFSIFCITSYGDRNLPQNRQTTDFLMLAAPSEGRFVGSNLVVALF